MIDPNVPDPLQSDRGEDRGLVLPAKVPRGRRDGRRRVGATLLLRFRQKLFRLPAGQLKLKAEPPELEGAQGLPITYT